MIIKRIAYWLAIIILSFWVAFIVARLLLNLEFVSSSLQTDLKLFFLLAIPFSILITLFGTIKPTDTRERKMTKIVGTSILAFVLAVVMLLSIWADMCTWSDRRILYKSVKNKKIKIIERVYECGALDSDNTQVEVHKVAYFTQFFIRSTQFDTAKMDKSKWIKTE